MPFLNPIPACLRFHSSLVLAATLAAGPASVTHADDVTFEFSGTVTDVLATYHPLCDCVPKEAER